MAHVHDNIPCTAQKAQNVRYWHLHAWQSEFQCRENVFASEKFFLLASSVSNS